MTKRLCILLSMVFLLVCILQSGINIVVKSESVLACEILPGPDPGPPHIL